MIAKANRFHGHNSLSLVYRKGQTFSVPQATLKYVPKKNDKPYRLAVVVSRKVDKKAVVRNRIRRRVYELFRNKQPRFTQNVDIIFTVHSAAVATMDSKELDKLIDHLLVKSTLFDQ